MPNTEQIILDNAPTKPSNDTQEVWLGTRKNDYGVSNYTLPGRFQTHQFSRDAFFFTLAIMGEIGGFFAMIYYGALGALAAYLGLVFIVFDLGFAYFHHQPTQTITWIKNAMALERAYSFAAPAHQTNTYYAQLRNLKKKMENRKKILAIVIALLAVAKIYVFYIGYLRPDIIFIFMVAVYLFVGFIHIQNTGYFVWEMRARILANRDTKKPVNVKGIHEIFANETPLAECSGTPKIEEVKLTKKFQIKDEKDKEVKVEDKKDKEVEVEDKKDKEVEVEDKKGKEVEVKCIAFIKGGSNEDIPIYIYKVELNSFLSDKIIEDATKTQASAPASVRLARELHRVQHNGPRPKSAKDFNSNASNIVRFDNGIQVRIPEPYQASIEPSDENKWKNELHSSEYNSRNLQFRINPKHNPNKSLQG